MSTGSPENPPKKPKQPLNVRTSIANRDKPLFTGRRPPGRFSDRSEFFTDSLNTSYIPSPSPTKSTASAGLGARPRQVLGNNRALGTNSRSSQHASEENKSPSSSSSVGLRRPEQPTRKPPSTTPQSTRIKRKPPVPTFSKKRESTNREVTRTPSPARKREPETLVSPTSDASASSPPREMAEAYQRIEDEEVLAGQEDDSVDDPDYSDGSGEQLQAQDMGRENPQRPSKSPTPPVTSKSASPQEGEDVFTTSEHHRTDRGDYTQSLDGESSMSFAPDPEDDTFDRVRSQYAKDEQRVRNAIGSNQQAFRKARTPRRGNLTLENLQRKDANARSGSSSLGSPSLSSRGSDPALNIPKDWGRKGRAGKTWLNRISGETGKFTGDLPRTKLAQALDVNEDSEKKQSSPIVDWITAASDVPVPSVEDEFLQQESHSRSSTPTSQLRRQSPSDKLRKWEYLEDDFTARSLQISDSPPIRIRGAALDAIRAREIQNLEKSAVTTNRLGELREKRSLEQVRRRSLSVHSDAMGSDAAGDGSQGLQIRRSSSKSSFKAFSERGTEVLVEEPLLEDIDGEPIPNSPVVVFSTNKSHTTTAVTAQQANGAWSHTSGRPKSQRSDSRDLLRQLARVSSASPSASPKQQESEKPMSGVKDKGAGKSSELDRGSDKQEVEKSSQVNGTHTSEESDDSTPLVHSYRPQNGAIITPQVSKQQNIYLKTPMVTGAWIETPLPTGVHGPPMPTPEALEVEKRLTTGINAALTKTEDLIKEATLVANPEQAPILSLEDTAPKLPKSALTAILDKAKKKNQRPSIADEKEEHDDTLQLDDSTIQSLEEFLARDTDVSDLLTPPRSSPASSPPDSHQKPHQKSHPTPLPPATAALASETGASETSTQEIQSYNTLTSRLSTLGLSIRDAKNGIASLERAVSAQPAASSALKDSECHEAGEFHDFIWPCTRCGCPGRDGTSEEWQTVSFSMPKLWTWRRGDRLPRLTWLGVVTLLGWTYFVANSIVNTLYLPPFYATSMKGWGVDYDRPRPPFLLWKVLWRSPAALLVKPLWHVLVFLVKFIAGSIGFLSGILAGDGNTATGGSSERPVAGSSKGWGPDVGIGDDEYL